MTAILSQAFLQRPSHGTTLSFVEDAEASVVHGDEEDSGHELPLAP